MTTSEARAPRVLIADDDEINLLLMRETLESAGFEVVAAGEGAEALKLAQTQRLDAALLDVQMPHVDGLEVCRRLRAAAATRFLPIVVITGRDDPESIERTYESGATDFISKPVNWTLIPHRLRYILRNAETDRRMRHLAYFDPLTGLPNRQSFAEAVGEALARVGESAARGGVAVLQIELGGLRRVAETFGTEIGEQVMRALARKLPSQLASRVRAAFRIDVACTAAEEFAVLVVGPDAGVLATEVAEAVARGFDEPVRVMEHEFFLRPTVGVAGFPEHGIDAKTLMMHAATARYHAQDAGGAQVHATYSRSMSSRARERIKLDAELRRAIRDEQLVLHFQPKLRASDGSLAGVEALLRWFHPDLGEISPARFIPIAEESGLILDIDEWTLQSACRQLRNWQLNGMETTVAVNVSGKHFLYGDPSVVAARELAASQVRPADLTIEITEGVLLRDAARVRQGLDAVRALGCKVAVDDFGTGYSSLAYLRGFPVDSLKIDRAFVQRVHSDPVDAAICTAVLALARSLGLVVTAEGVEIEEQRVWLARHGCDELQGFLFSRAVSPVEIERRYGSQTGLFRSLAG
jgi:diguanylate cyclase (GGDEF)-like protein